MVQPIDLIDPIDRIGRIDGAEQLDPFLATVGEGYAHPDLGLQRAQR